MTWRHLNHPNIVPFKGVTFEPLQLVSEWMLGGELREYIRVNYDVNLIGLVGLFLHLLNVTSSPRQLFGIAKGLGYLHSCNVIHGDIKGVRGSVYILKPMLMVIGAGEYTSRCGWKRTNCGLWSCNCRTRYKLAR